MIDFESHVDHNLKFISKESIFEINLPHDLQIIIFSFVGFTPRTNEELREAVDLWINNESEALKKYGHISYWNTQYITNMRELFSDAESFNEPLNWDTKKVINMSYMFTNAKSFNQPLNFNTSKVTNMSLMFCHAESFNRSLNFNTENVTDMSSMFDSTKLFNQPLNFNTEKVTKMTFMFFDCPISEESKCSGAS